MQAHVGKNMVSKICSEKQSRRLPKILVEIFLQIGVLIGRQKFSSVMLRKTLQKNVNGGSSAD